MTRLDGWFRPDTVKRALGVAAVVGPILTLINQPEAVLGLDFGPWVLTKIALTFLVPYCVSSYSSVRALAQAASRICNGSDRAASKSSSEPDSGQGGHR
jgi:hypothetical protein